MFGNLFLRPTAFEAKFLNAHCFNFLSAVPTQIRNRLLDEHDTKATAARHGRDSRPTGQDRNMSMPKLRPGFG